MKTGGTGKDKHLFIEKRLAYITYIVLHLTNMQENGIDQFTNGFSDTFMLCLWKITKYQRRALLSWHFYSLRVYMNLWWLFWQEKCVCTFSFYKCRRSHWLYWAVNRLLKTIPCLVMSSFGLACLLALLCSVFYIPVKHFGRTVDYKSPFCITFSFFFFSK